MNNNLPPRMRHKFKLRNPKRQCHKESNDDIQLMADNLLKLQREMTEEFHSTTEDQIKYNQEEEQENNKEIQNDNQSQHQYPINNEPQYSSNPTARNQRQQQNEHQHQPTKQQDIPNKRQNIKQLLQKSYQKYLQQNKFSSNYEQKINQLIDTEDQIMTIGNTIALFQMVYFFKEILTKEVLNQIQFKAFQSVLALEQSRVEMENEQSKDQSQKSQRQLLRISYAELIAICGIPSQQIVDYYLHQIIQNPQSFQQSFKVLINMGNLGLSTLIKIVNQDFDQLSQKVLKKLSKTDLIISQIIVPQIYSDLVSVASSTKDKNTALFLLSKIGEIAHSQQLIQILLSFFKSNSIDKNLLISAIISTGKQQGQKILINLLQQQSLNEDIAVFIIKCLSLSYQIRKKMKLNIQICEYSIVDLLQLNKLYFYQGQNKSFLNQDNKNQDTLFVNSRMLLSLAEKFVNDQQKEQTIDNSLVNGTQCIKSFILPQIISREEEKQELPNLQIINLFLTILQRTKQKTKIKTALIEAFGNIPLPYNSSQVIQKIVIYLFSSDPAVLSTTCLTLKKLKFIPSNKVIHRLNELLKHNLWKVRISACQAIGSLLRQPVDKVLQTLIKCLKDGSINRQLVCQTMLKIHPLCQQLLIEILKSSKDSKIQQIILCSFNEKQILLSDNLLKILEAIFEFSKNQRKQIRYICIGVVNSLRKLSSQEHIDLSPFKEKNILPFYYNFLSDPCSQIRDLALNLILEFGSYAELVLIEGMTKGRVNCKIECAKGLGQRGIQNFRALLLGMRDMNDKVRQQCSLSILQNFDVQQIVNEYQDQQSQCVSLVYNIKDLIETIQTLQPEIKIFLSQLMSRLLQNVVNFKVEQLDEDEEIQKQINEFRQSMKLRKQVQQSLSTNFQHQTQDAENINPNLYVEIQNQKKLKRTQNLTVNQQKVTNQKRSNNQKRYYFRLNQAIQN